MKKNLEKETAEKVTNINFFRLLMAFLSYVPLRFPASTNILHFIFFIFEVYSYLEKHQ
jgi:hypothetical protein